MYRNYLKFPQQMLNESIYKILGYSSKVKWNVIFVSLYNSST